MQAIRDPFRHLPDPLPPRRVLLVLAGYDLERHDGRTLRLRGSSWTRFAVEHGTERPILQVGPGITSVTSSHRELCRCDAPIGIGQMRVPHRLLYD